jgi:hypothetical protein
VCIRIVVIYVTQIPMIVVTAYDNRIAYLTSQLL